MNKENNTISTFDSIKNEVLDSIDSFIYAKYLSGKYTYVNQALLDLFEKKLLDVIGFDDGHFYDLIFSKQSQLNDDLVMSKALRVESEDKNFIKTC